MRNVKAYYDAAQAAHQLVEAKADEIDGLFNQGKTEDAPEIIPGVGQVESRCQSCRSALHGYV